MNNIQTYLERLLAFALHSELIEEADIVPSRNALLDLFRIDEPLSEADMADAWTYPVPDSAVTVLEPMLDYAAEIGLLPENNGTYRDLLDARIMGILMPRASETNRRFKEWAESSIVAATDYFYKQSVASNYIRMDRVAKNQYWLTETSYGALEITINLSKPEKDPKEIALLKNAPSANYPKCLLCSENVGYAGRLNHPARQNHRIIPVQLCGEPWFFQYSPYVYYKEHSILLSSLHTPMKIAPITFRRLIDFVEQLPHYFIGSNADLPIVGGSILDHDHFQAGRHRFPMERAPIESYYDHADFAGVSAGIVSWPLSVIRLTSRDKEPLLAAANHILEAWREFSDPSRDLIAFSEINDVRIPHNTVTPIARLNDAEELELDLVLRNNRTNEQHPEGIFHPHQHLHHVKQENIGLIEVMGLAVLPGRLQQELRDISLYLTGEEDFSTPTIEQPLLKHTAWITDLIARYGTSLSMAEADSILQQEVGLKFLEVLTNAGVYKRDINGSEGFHLFLNNTGFKNVNRSI